jgi:hypothetical protein
LHLASAARAQREAVRDRRVVTRGARQLTAKYVVGERTFLALSGNYSLKQETVCNRAQLCKMAEEIIICWNEMGLEIFSHRGGTRAGKAFAA